MRTKTIYRGGNSKSHNAECAEEDGRYSLTVAAKKLGISVPLFKKAIIKCGYQSTEWHHVSKYANRVDYYDTIELLCNYKFIVFLKNTAKNNRLFIHALRELAKERLTERLTPKTQDKRFAKGFETALRNRCSVLKIPFNALFEALPGDQTLEAKGNYRVIKNGTYEQPELRVCYTGVYETGHTLTVARVKYIIPFKLTIDNIRAVFKNNPSWVKIRFIKGRKVFINRRNDNTYAWILNKAWLLKGIENLKNGTYFTAYNSGASVSDASHKCKKIIEAKYSTEKH